MILDANKITEVERKEIDAFIKSTPGSVREKMMVVTQKLLDAYSLQENINLHLDSIALFDIGIAKPEISIILKKLENKGFISLNNQRQQIRLTDKLEVFAELLNLALLPLPLLSDYFIQQEQRRQDRIAHMSFFQPSAPLSIDQSTTPATIIWPGKNGDYFYKDKKIEISTKRLYYKVFDAAYRCRDQDDFSSYEDINTALANDFDIKSDESSSDPNKRIKNALSSHQGFFRYAKVNGKVLKNKLPGQPGTKMIEIIPSEGVQFNIKIL